MPVHPRMKIKKKTKKLAESNDNFETLVNTTFVTKVHRYPRAEAVQIDVVVSLGSLKNFNLNLGI